jgi:CHAD domain-containing protein
MTGGSTRMDKPIRRRLHAVETAVAAVLPDLDAEPVHQLRVALRRLRAALQLTDKRARALLDREAHALLKAAGLTRDMAVLMAWSENATGPSPATLTELQARLTAELPLAHGRLRSALALWQTLEPTAHVTLERRRALRKFRRRVKQLQGEMDQHPKRLTVKRAHRLRARVRELRYQAEVLAELGWHIPPAVLARLAELQQRLGAVQDAQVRLLRLRQMPISAPELRDVRAERRRCQRSAARRIRRLSAADWLRDLRHLQR